MADLGAIGDLTSPPIVWSLGRENWCMSRTQYGVSAVLTHETDLCQSLEIDFGDLGGSVSLEGVGVARVIRARHRTSGRTIAQTVSAAGTGAWALRVPTNLILDVHVIAESGDGCDIYLPDRTPV